MASKLTPQALIRFLQTPISAVPQIVRASDTTSPYTPPSKEFLVPWMTKLPSHLHLSSQLPQDLCNSLFAFLAAGDEVPHAEDESAYQRDFDKCVRKLDGLTIGQETDVNSYYPWTVNDIVTSTCNMYEFDVGYGTGPKVFNLLPDHSYRQKTSNKELTVFEHKNPTCANAHFPGMIELARNDTPFHLERRSTDSQSIIDKLALSLATKNLEFGAVHCLTKYQIMRIVTKTGYRPIALLSEPISINDEKTPILAVIISLLLRRKHELPPLPDPAIPEGLWEQTPESDGDKPPPPDPSGRGMSGRGRGRGSGRGGGERGKRGRGGNDGGQIGPADCEGYDPNQHGISYWARNPDEVFSGSKLANLLDSVAVVPYFFDMESDFYANNLAYAERIPDSTFWIHPDNNSTIPSSHSFSPHSNPDHGIITITPSQVNQTPPPSPPAEEIALRINEEVSHGENSWIVKGAFWSTAPLPLSPRVIVKKFNSVEDCEHELSIYRHLASIAGQVIPGVYGAFKANGEFEDFGMLWLEDVGNKSLDDDADEDVRKMVYYAVLKIHQLGVEHRDLHGNNIVVTNLPTGPQIKIIDFHFASLHECPGEESCSELRHLRDRLGI